MGNWTREGRCQVCVASSVSRAPKEMLDLFWHIRESMPYEIVVPEVTNIENTAAGDAKQPLWHLRFRIPLRIPCYKKLIAYPTDSDLNKDDPSV